jgi:hypothetical protein
VRNVCIVSFEAIQTRINLSSSCPHQTAFTIRKKSSLLPCQRIRFVWRMPTVQLASARHCSGKAASSPRPPPEPACSSDLLLAESAPDCLRRGGLRQDPGRVLSLSTSPWSRPPPPLATSLPRSRPSRAPQHQTSWLHHRGADSCTLFQNCA